MPSRFVGGAIGVTSTIGGNAVAGFVDVTETAATDGVGILAVPAVHVAVAGGTSAFLSASGNYAYTHYLRTPLINGITDVLNSTYSAANALLKYGNGE